MTHTTPEIIIGTLITFILTYVIFKIIKLPKTENNKILIRESENWLKNKL